LKVNKIMEPEALKSTQSSEEKRKETQDDMQTLACLKAERDDIVNRCKENGNFGMYSEILDAFFKVIRHYDAILY